MYATAIRDQFIQFFKQKGHRHQEAVPIVHKEDPSLLFVNAGMNPFKDIILGNQPIIHSRIATAQPCLRVSGKHNDLEAVGVDTYHHTLFEMLGNWSFGDYFKEEAIAWAWELLTTIYKLPQDRLYVTIFAGDAHLPQDQEAASIWAKFLPPSHILPFGKEANFWEMGVSGPCGPCSEIHIDLRSEEERGSLSGASWVNQGHPQVVEIWNLVFMQYNRQARGALVELPHKHIDTGMGLERLAMVMQGKTSTYDSDIFTPLIAHIAAIAGKKYEGAEAVAMRVIADHLRAVVFAIADGQLPAATKGGYVVRRILRRAIRYGYSHLGIELPFIHQLVPTLLNQMGSFYPNLYQHHIAPIIQQEEAGFLKTLAAGLQRFHGLTTDREVLPGRVAFELYDTYGFPFDLTQLMAKEKGLVLDEAGFQEALQKQQARSHQDAARVYGDWEVLHAGRQAHFVGYDQTRVTTSLLQWRSLTHKQHTYYQLVLEETPFYPEGGGQVADVGFIVSGEEQIRVIDVQREHGLILHTVHQLPTAIAHPLLAQVAVDKRRLAAANHTATHLLQAALKAVLGSHVVQKGSWVTPDGLRFDFAHATKPTAAEMEAVALWVNSQISANITRIEERNVPLAAAKARGIQALFEYGTHVRVITFGESSELCGGTHVAATGEIGFFKIITEASIGSGLRRIEAVTAVAAQKWVSQKLETLSSIALLLKQPKDLVKTVADLWYEKKQLEKAVAAYQAQVVQQVATQLVVEAIGTAYLVVQAVQVPEVAALRQIAFQLKTQYRDLAVVLATQLAGKAYMVVLLSGSLLDSFHAPTLIQAVAPLIGGLGGGQPALATAGGTNSAGIPAALKAAKRLCLAGIIP